MTEETLNEFFFILFQNMSLSVYALNILIFEVIFIFLKELITNIEIDQN